MQNYKYKFSVIIPVYNVENYLEETVESVISQSIGFKKNIEIIFVNDGSPDNSGEICERYRNKYPNNIKYVVKENGGVSSARNLGLEYAEGKYVNFLDSDDKWGEPAFEKVYKFFEQYGDEVDVVCNRMKIFDARSAFHALDYKFHNGTRVIDILDEEDCECVHLHITSAFIRREAITDERFNEKVKFGEDALFINAIILKKLKYGVIHDGFHFYRKRRDQSSATQTQKLNPEYYTVSPELYYSGLIEMSRKYCGRVIPYIQNLLVYDIGWRVNLEPPEEIVEDKQFYDDYCALLRDKLSVVDDDIIVNTRYHKNIAKKVALMKLKNDTDLLSETVFDPEEGTIKYKDINIFVPSNNNHCCRISFFDIKGGMLNINGLIARWVFECCPGNEFEVAIKINKKLYPVTLSEYPFAPESNFFGSRNRNFYFESVIDIKKFFKKKDRMSVRIALIINGVPYDLSLDYGKFLSNTKVFKPGYRIKGKYVIMCKRKRILVYCPEDLKKEARSLEKECRKWLKKEKLKDILKLRKRAMWLRKTTFRGKKLWLISDRFDKAGDNAEAFFKFICSYQEKDKSIVPVFVISKESKDAKRLSKYGKVIHFEDKDYKPYYLCADKIINSSGLEISTNPLSGEERPYLTDLVRSDFIFLQHGITYNDVSSWLHKHNKNIRLFITAAEREKNSIVNGRYYYGEKEVALTGFARYDLLENRTEKKIVIIPTWRASIKESYNAKTESVYFDGFKETDYFKFYNSLINDEKLLETMRAKGYKGLFCLHPIHSKQSVDFEENDVFEVNQGFVDYKNIFSTSALMVTDYSSVFFDFAYLRKPLVYAQFDKENFYEGQNYEEGSFDWAEEGFGPVCYDLESTANAIIASVERDCENEQKYLDRINKFFAFSDKNNCERIYKAIMEIG